MLPSHLEPLIFGNDPILRVMETDSRFSWFSGWVSEWNPQKVGHLQGFSGQPGLIQVGFEESQKAPWSKPTNTSGALFGAIHKGFRVLHQMVQKLMLKPRVFEQWCVYFRGPPKIRFGGQKDGFVFGLST